MIQQGIAVPKKLRPVLLALLEARIYASDAQVSEWDFAVSIDCLKKAGANEADLRWLTLKQFASHAREVTVEGDDGREFRPSGNLTFCERTCFILTEAGQLTVQAESVQYAGPLTRANGNGRLKKGTEPLLPSWDPGSRKLHYGDQIVKRFKWPASNQEAVLCAFQEEEWPERIDDPLSPQPDQNPKRRLADTIKCLNRKQLNALIQFHGDGTGEGVVWERVASNDACNRV